MAIIDRWKFWVGSVAGHRDGVRGDSTGSAFRARRPDAPGIDTRPRDGALVASPGPPSSVSTLGRLADNLGEHLLVTGPPLSRRPLAGRATRDLPRSESWTVFQWPASPLGQLDDSSRLSTPRKTVAGGHGVAGSHSHRLMRGDGWAACSADPKARRTRGRRPVG